MSINNQRVSEIKSWVASKRNNPNNSTAPTDLTIALAYLDELMGTAVNNETGYSESQADYFGRNNTGSYTQSSLAQQIDDVEKGNVVPR